MTPDLGQGACQAIEDALCLPQTLMEKDTIDQALAAYERQRHPRTARLMNQSRIIGKVSNFSNPLLVSLRFMMLKSLSAGKSLDGFESMIRPQAG
jgi:2-polyprenyl-6-methoxyphenol hydroxylase-like FAD-dependent oxidoreductase